MDPCGSMWARIHVDPCMDPCGSRGHGSMWIHVDPRGHGYRCGSMWIRVGTDTCGSMWARIHVDPCGSMWIHVGTDPYSTSTDQWSRGLFEMPCTCAVHLHMCSALAHVQCTCTCAVHMHSTAGLGWAAAAGVNMACMTRWTFVMLLAA